MRPPSWFPSTRARQRWRLATPLAASALVLTACAGATLDAVLPSTAPATTSAVESATPATSTPVALDFTGTTITGAAFEGAALAGQPVIMWFWAPWCTICRAEAPDLAAVAEEFEGRVTFVGVAGRGPIEDMQAFVAETSTDAITHVADIDGILWSEFGVIAQPSFVFVAPTGEAQAFTGGLGAEELRDAANQLLAL